MPGDQLIQKKQYYLPYHWFYNPQDFVGREYWGYLELALKNSGATKVDSILDAGCGDGMFLSILHRRGYDNLTGYDYTEQAISFAKALAPSVDFEIKNLLAPIEKRFDYIFLIETLEHIDPKDIAVILKNLRAALNDGGKLVITVPSINKPLPEKHYQHFTVAKLRDYLTPSGLTEIGFFGQDYKPFVYKLLDNRFYDLKPLRKWFNLKIYPKYFNQVAVEKGERLIAIYQK
ncbi:MAG: class I SAM-dependent methyltransferase [Patescibacteria group bacterium]|nr:class I SAM-dependent methyltransferase [Patescibacteria group bacterium]